MFTQFDGTEVYSLMEMKLHTGKKHQLRLACSHALGAPILGDRKYGYTQANDLFRRSFKYTAIQERKLFVNTVLLHSRELVVPTEPNSLATKTFTCDYPDSFEKVLN
jgi:23S rRNA-/tRNA-specific pseudouridylate synthase